MFVFQATSRILGGHSRLALLSTQSLIPATGQGTCYHWSTRLQDTHNYPVFEKNNSDWKHLIRKHYTSKEVEFMNFSSSSHFRTPNSKYVPSVNNSLASDWSSPSVNTVSLNRSFHSLNQPQNVLGRHPLLNTNHQVDQRIQSFSVTTKSILESSPPSVQPYLRLIRFDKPIGTYLLFWPCTWSIALAADPGHLPDLYLLTMFGAGAFLMRGAGCIINDMWDKDFDKMVARTRTRPLASGELTHFQALVFLGSQLSLALAILLQFNTHSILLGAASMGLVVTYPLAKRYTYWPQLMLGFTFNYGVLLGWSTVKGYTDWSLLLPMYAGGIAWTLIYDTIYAHQDKYDDMLIGVKSTALKLGDQTKPWLTGFSTVMVSGLTLSGYLCDQTWPFYLGVAATASHLAHQLYTVDLDNADDCASKFRSNTQIGIIMFLAIVFGSLMKGTTMKEDKKSDDNLTNKK